MPKPPPGLFVTGTDTGVGKTYVAALIAADLVRQGIRVGVYKPVESGVAEPSNGSDSERLWSAAGKPGTLNQVCPQRFRAPVAPHLAARLENREIDSDLLRRGIDDWRQCSELVLVEGAGGLMSPLGDDEYVADLARDLGYPLLVVAPNVLGTINQTLQTLITAENVHGGLSVAGVILNDQQPANDSSVDSNLVQLQARCRPPVLMQVGWQAREIPANIDWMSLATLNPSKHRRNR